MTDESPPPAGHNGPSHDDIRMAAHEVVKLNAERKALGARISAYRKQLKAQGFTLGVLDAVITMLEWEPSEVKAHYAERDWYAEAMRLPVGSQLELYGDAATPDAVKDQLKWRNVGFKDGLAGRGWPDQAPDGCGPDMLQSYGQGHEEGQQTVLTAFAARNERRTSVMSDEPPADKPKRGGKKKAPPVLVADDEGEAPGGPSDDEQLPDETTTH